MAMRVSNLQQTAVDGEAPVRNSRRLTVTTKKNALMHLKNIYNTEELTKLATPKDFRSSSNSRHAPDLMGREEACALFRVAGIE